ncbi:MAG: LysR family transcriptional regulator [Gammaproteobacteria bacterium]|nr:LysR family transcriptional regulator [Gammaproteobacteria bacterium]
MAIDLKHLRTFVTVVEELSFRKAATRLNLTQPPVSLQIRHLETELGVQLIERGGRKKMQLTAAGKILLEGARETLRVAERTIESVALFSEGKSGHLRIGHTDDFQHGLLPQTLAKYHAKFPGVRVSLQQRTSAHVTEQILNGELDLGFVCLPIPRLDTSIVMQSLPSTPIVAIVPANHPLADKDRIWLRELADESFYLLPTDMMSGFSSQVSRLFAQASISPITIGMAEISNITAQIVANGFGVTLTSLSSIEGSVGGVSILQLNDPKPELQLGLIYTSTDRELPLVQAFLNVVSCCICQE